MAADNGRVGGSRPKPETQKWKIGKLTPKNMKRGGEEFDMDDTEADDGEELWLDADAELLEELGREASYQDEAIGEFVERACQEKARRH